MVCFDTTFIADLLRKNPSAEKALINLENENDNLCTTIITLAELFYGAYRSRNLDKEKSKIQQALSNFLILGMDAKSAEKFGEILSLLDDSGQRVSDRDVLISAIAISHGESAIVTRNRKDFDRIPGITIITY
jgi:tRNA(fMet)-specific endonuclease VapC